MLGSFPSAYMPFPGHLPMFFGGHLPSRSTESTSPPAAGEIAATQTALNRYTFMDPRVQQRAGMFFPGVSPFLPMRPFAMLPVHNAGELRRDTPINLSARHASQRTLNPAEKLRSPCGEQDYIDDGDLMHATYRNGSPPMHDLSPGE